MVRSWSPIPVLLMALVLTCGMLLPGWAASRPSEPGLPLVTFDHLENQFTSPPQLKLHDGDVFEIRIVNTSSSEFQYSVAGIEIKKEGEQKEAAVNSIGLGDLDSKGLWVRHEDKYAGYVIKIQREAGTLAVNDSSGKHVGSLQTAEITVRVDTLKWDYELAGAFTASGLTDPKFSLRDNGDGKKIVVEDKNAGDRARLGVGAFIHLYHTNFPWLALTFGLGINDGSRTTYFAGPTLRFGGKGALTAGYALGGVDRLPSGVRVNEPAPNDNALNNLGTRNVGKFFVAFSYAFLNPGVDVLKKAFAGSSSPVAAGSTTSGGKPAGGTSGNNNQPNGPDGNQIINNSGKPPRK